MRRPLVAMAVVGSLVLSCAPKGTVTVTLDDFSVTARPDSVPAGAVTFRVRNTGDVAHEFVLMRTRLAADKLPLRRQRARLSAKRISVVRRVGQMEAGSSREVSVAVRRGRYVLICNIAGHYQSGMRAPFAVR